MQKTVFPLIFFTLTLALTWNASLHGAEGESRYVDGILAVVNTEVITVSQVLRQTMARERNMARQLTRDEFRKQVNLLREETLEFLINNELMAVEFEARGYTLPPEFVNEQLDAVVARETQGDWELFQSQLQDEGMSLDEFKKKLSRRLAGEALFDEEIRRKVTVTEQDIEDYYQANREEFTRPQSVHLQIIQISSADRNGEAMRERLQQIAQELGQGKSFEDVAREYSDHPTADAGGDMGWVAADDLNDSFKPVVYSAEIDKISPPIALQDGIYILRVRERKEEKLEPFSNVRQEIEQTLRENKQRERYSEFIQQLRDKFYIKTFI